MLAARLVELKSALCLEELPPLQAGNGQAVVDLKAAALNRRDFWITQGMYPGITTPVVLGSDGAGLVSAVGSPNDERWVGQEVVVNPGLAWGSATTHQAGAFHILGMPTDGTFAQQVVVPVSQLHAKPTHLDWEAAAALPLAGLTAYRALFTQGQLQQGQSVLVTGAGGGVATFAVQFAATAGAHVAISSSSNAKLESARALGAEHGFNYRDDDWSTRARDACGGFDLIIDGAGGAQYGTLMSIANPGGTIVNYGATAGPPETIDLFKLFWKQLRLVGSTMGSPADFEAMLAFVQTHTVAPVVDSTLNLKDVNAALDRMKQTQQFGKLVLRCSQ